MSNIEKLFYSIDKEVEVIKKQENSNYFKALVEYLNLEDDEKYFSLVDNYSKEEIKKVYQFLVLKAYRELQNINYNITPEIISIYIKSIVDIIFKDKDINIADFASGSGGILLELASNNRVLTSIELDSYFSKLQQNIFNIMELEVSIINQDTLKPINIELQDVVVSDVPLGYYFDEDNSLNYKLCSSEGASLNSLLFLEQATNYLKENGVAILVLPKQIMNLTNDVKKFIEKDININAFILLPEEMFKNKEQQKVIVIATKKGQKILPEKVFLSEIPSYQNKNGYEIFKNNLKNWLCGN